MLRTKIENNVLRRTRQFTTLDVARTTGASLRHTRRVILDLRLSGEISVAGNNTYFVIN